MRFAAEIRRAIGEEAGIAVRYTVVDGQGGYFENIRRIGEFSPTAVVLCGKKQNLRVEGRNLSIGKLCEGDLTIHGEIVKVERV